jgi:hypothetical protein
MTKGKHMYNGHKNWAHWNVSLWVNNDEGLYRNAMLWLQASGGSRKRAARAMFHALTSADFGTPIPKTPDGARYSISALYHAMDGMKA